MFRIRRAHQPGAAPQYRAFMAVGHRRGLPLRPAGADAPVLHLPDADVLGGSDSGDDLPARRNLRNLGIFSYQAFEEGAAKKETDGRRGT